MDKKIGITMKTHRLLYILILFTNNLFSQSNNFVGTWQINSGIVGSALHENYRFYENGNFIYNFDSYDDAKRIISVSGTYMVNSDTLVFKIIQRTEIIGGIIIKGSEGYQNGWVLFGGEIKTFIQENSIPEVTIWNITENNNNKSLILKIDSDIYYKISNDPEFN